MEIAAFIDRDGVINELLSYEFGDDKVTYITKKEEIKIINRVDKAIKLLNENNVKVIVVSNQPQVARGLVTVEEVDEINKHINNLLGDANVDSFYFCPHRPTKGVNEYGIECECRKPKPGLILKAAKEHNVDLKNSFMIGDRISDIKSGNLAGCKTILVETGYGGKEGFQDAVPNYKAKDLYGAVEEILKRKIKLFINAGGKGERLHPLTKDIPKPMVPVNGKPVLHHYVDWAKENDIKEIVMMNGYKAEKIVDYFEDGKKFGIPIKHSIEESPLDSGGPIRLAKNHVDGTFCYVNGDNICKIDLEKVTNFHKKNNNDLTIVLVEKEKGYGDFLKLDGDDNVVELLRKDSENLDDKGLAHAGMCIIEPKILDLMDKEVFNFEHYVFPKAIEKGLKVKGYTTNELIEDMGTVERLRAVENLLKGENKMRILVTGAGGMMGNHLLDFLVDKGHDVLGFDFVPTTDIRELNPKAEFVECDIRDRHKLTNLLNRFRPEIIFHLAAQSYPTVSWERPDYTIETNVLGTVNLFETVKELKLDPVILNACTSGEYGYVEEKDVPIKETQELKPLHPYGVSKVAQEFLAYQYFKNFGIKSVSVRIFNTTGPKKVNDVCSDWTRQIVLMEKGLQDKIMTVGNLETKRAITDVRDLIEAFWVAVNKCDHGVTYNLSGEKVYLMKDILEELKTLTKIEFEVKQDPKLIRPTDEPIIYGDTTKFKEKTGWVQKIELRQTLQDMLDYWRKKL